MKPVKWGIISTANIGMEKVIPGMMKSKDMEIVAIASRDLRRAKAAASKLGIPKAYGSYDELFDDPEIEAVYNPTPNHLHVRLTLDAARAGKHVLCEKPIAISARGALALRSVARKVHIAEAFMVRHALQWIDAKKRVKKGEIGEVRAIQVMFSYFNKDPNNVRNMADIGGGGLLDIGCYPVTIARYVFDGDPIRAAATVDYDPKFRTDRLAGGILEFTGGRHLTFTCSTQLAPYQRVHIMGTKGRIEIEIPFNAPPNKPNRLFVQGMQMNEGTWHSFPVSDQYQLQAENFSRIIRKTQKPVWAVEDAITNMRILDALFKSGNSGRFEKIA
jgi:predicted dehydrogenase